MARRSYWRELNAGVATASEAGAVADVDAGLGDKARRNLQCGDISAGSHRRVPRGPSRNIREASDCASSQLRNVRLSASAWSIKIPESSHISSSQGDVCAISTKDTISMHQRDPIPAKQQSICRHSRYQQT